MCSVMIATTWFAGRPSQRDPLRRACLYAAGTATAVVVLAAGNAWVGLAAIVLFGIPQAFYMAIVPNWCAERFGHHGQGAVMGLLSTTFCLANILMALAGAVLTLIDTRLILLLGAALTASSAWRLHTWRGEMAANASLRVVQS
jgi:DHA1 family tetracycline resistance protein-like MFS transporter